MPRKLAALLVALALASPLAGCSKKLVTDASFRLPEGTPSTQLELFTWLDGSNAKIRIKDRGQIAKVDFTNQPATTDSLELDATGHPRITTFRLFTPGTVHGIVLNRTGAEGVEIWRSEANGGVRRLFDFALTPTKRWLDRGTDAYEFHDSDPQRPLNATYYARALVGGMSGATSPLSNGSVPTGTPLTQIRYTAERFGTAAGHLFVEADSNIVMQWSPVPGASKYMIQIFEYQGKVLTLDQRILTGVPAPLLLFPTHDHLVATVPGSVTEYRLGDAGATIYTDDPLRMRQEYYVRISAFDATGQMIGTTTGPTIATTADLSRVPIWSGDHTPRDYFLDFSDPEVAGASPPAYLMYSRGAIWVSPGADPVPPGGGGE